MKVEQRIERQPVAPVPIREDVEFEIIEMLTLEAQRYELAMFRTLAERLPTVLPKRPGDEYNGWYLDGESKVWFLSDNLEDKLVLILYPSVFRDPKRLAAARSLFEEVTGAPAIEEERAWQIKHYPYARKGEASTQSAVHGKAQAARDAKEQQQAA